MIKFILILLAVSFTALSIYGKLCADPYFCKIFYGLPGCGKSTHIAYTGVQVNTGKLKPFTKVYCNAPDVGGTYYFNLQELIKINSKRDENDYIIPFEENSIVCIDEAGIAVNGRDWKSFSKFLQYLCRKFRHHKISLYFYSQGFSDADKTIRTNCHQLLMIKKIFNCISFVRPIHKSLGLGKDSNGNGQPCEVYKYASIFSSKFIFIPRYVGLFNSHEVQASIVPTESIFNEYTDRFNYVKSTPLYIKYVFISSFNHLKLYIQYFSDLIRSKLIRR